MNTIVTPNLRDAPSVTPDSSPSALSWAAIIGGALAASALSLLLLVLGTGLGFTSVSAYQTEGAAATTVGIAAALWLIVTQIVSSGIGGYLAGRLRTRWTSVHTDEVYFRDTAHGFLVWALGAIISAVLLASAASSLIGGGASLLSGVGGGIAHVAGSAGQAAAGNASDPSAYITDTLLRSDHPAANGDAQATTAEVGRIVSTSLKTGDMSAGDKTYVAQVISARTGLNQADAEKRVNDTIQQAKDTAAKAEAKARDAADATRSASAYAALWAVVSMLIGAFCASYGALVGGKARDHVPTAR